MQVSAKIALLGYNNWNMEGKVGVSITYITDRVEKIGATGIVVQDQYSVFTESMEGQLYPDLGVYDAKFTIGMAKVGESKKQVQKLSLTEIGVKVGELSDFFKPKASKKG